MKLLARAIGLAVLAGAFVAATVVLVVAGPGGLNTNGSHVDWPAVAAVAAVVAAFFSAVTAASVAMAAREYDRRAKETADRERVESQRDRVSRWPYIRADIGFSAVRSRGFDPPMVTHTYRLEELRWQEDALPDLSALATATGGHSLVLWVRNLANGAISIADSVRVAVQLSWMPRDTPGRLPSVARFEVEFAYVAPQQATAVELVMVRSDVLSILAEIRDVRYRDIFGNESSDCHGALVMQYSGGEVRNERLVRRNSLEEDASEIHEDGLPRPDSAGHRR